MSTEIFHVRHNGERIGFAAYANASDIWCQPIWALRSEANGRVWWRCEDAQHELAWVDLWLSDSDTDPDTEHCRLKACLSCRALVPPPHDGYAYHEYGCEMGKACQCDMGTSWDGR